MVGYAYSAPPCQRPWVYSLLAERFFIPCEKHLACKKNEANIFCVDCSSSICQHCLSSHSSHRLLQIRRYVYHDVIRIQDIQKLVDCSQVQTYIINSAKVIFLNQRPQSRPSKGLGNICQSCDRGLQDAYRYCSLACKVDAVVAEGKDLQDLLRRCNWLSLPDSRNCSPCESLKGCELENAEQLSPNSVLQEATSSPTSSGSTRSTVNDEWRPLLFTKADRRRHSRNCKRGIDANPHVQMMRLLVWRGKDANSAMQRSRRRKGTPHRSPFS